MHRRGLTFRELARRTGLAPATLNRYASGLRRPPSDERIAAIAAAVGEEPEVFFEWRRRRALERVASSPQMVEALWQRR